MDINNFFDQDECKIFNFGPLLFKAKLSQQVIDKFLDLGNCSNIEFKDNLANVLYEEKNYSLEDKQTLLEMMTPMLQQYRNVRDQWYGLEETSGEVLELEDLWINYMKSGDYFPYHDHSSDIGFVIFLKVPPELKAEHDEFKMKSKFPGPGSLDFMSGLRRSQFITGKNFFPEEGDIFIFPGGLYHSVTSFKSDVMRISVSGNFNVKKMLPNSN
jgi:hypothetical protein